MNLLGKDVFMNRKKVSFIILPYIFNVIILMYIVFCIPLLIFLLFFPIVVLIFMLSKLLYSLLKNIPVLSFRDETLFLPNQPISRIKISDIRNFKLVAFSNKWYHPINPFEDTSNSFYDILAIELTDNNKYLQNAKWNWRYRLKRRVKSGIPIIHLRLAFLNINPGELLRICNNAIGNGYEYTESDLLIEVFKWD